MHTGIISFCDRISHNIRSNDVKDTILNQIYTLCNIRIIQKHYYKLDETNIIHIKKSPHLMCLRSNGNPYYMFFTKYNDIPIIYFIDKKIHPGYQKPRIILVKGLFDISLFENTLLDGEMVKQLNGKWCFLINDIIAYENKYLEKTILPERLKILYELLDKKHVEDDKMDVCIFKIKTYFNTYKESINELIDISKKLDYTCRGIYLWSYNLKYKPKLFNFDEKIIVDVVRKTKDETTFKTINKINEIQTTVSSSILQNSSNIPLPKKEDEEKILWITKTEEPDVYNLYDGENVLTSKKIGIAHIPNMSVSKMLRLSFKNKNASTILKFKCIYNNTFNKWTPIELMN